MFRVMSENGETVGDFFTRNAAEFLVAARTVIKKSAEFRKQKVDGYYIVPLNTTLAVNSTDTDVEDDNPIILPDGREWVRPSQCLSGVSIHLKMIMDKKKITEVKKTKTVLNRKRLKK